MITFKPIYKPEIGKVRIEYVCGHEWNAPNILVKLHRSGTKTISFTVDADDDFSICPYCRIQKLKKSIERAPK